MSIEKKIDRKISYLIEKVKAGAFDKSPHAELIRSKHEIDSYNNSLDHKRSKEIFASLDAAMFVFEKLGESPAVKVIARTDYEELRPLLKVVAHDTRKFKITGKSVASIYKQVRDTENTLYHKLYSISTPYSHLHYISERMDWKAKEIEDFDRKVMERAGRNQTLIASFFFYSLPLLLYPPHLGLANQLQVLLYWGNMSALRLSNACIRNIEKTSKFYKLVDKKLLPVLPEKIKEIYKGIFEKLQNLERRGTFEPREGLADWVGYKLCKFIRGIERCLNKLGFSLPYAILLGSAIASGANINWLSIAYWVYGIPTTVLLYRGLKSVKMRLKAKIAGKSLEEIAKKSAEKLYLKEVEKERPTPRKKGIRRGVARAISRFKIPLGSYYVDLLSLRVRKRLGSPKINEIKDAIIEDLSSRYSSEVIDMLKNIEIEVGEKALHDAIGERSTVEAAIYTYPFKRKFWEESYNYSLDSLKKYLKRRVEIERSLGGEIYLHYGGKKKKYSERDLEKIIKESRKLYSDRAFKLKRDFSVTSEAGEIILRVEFEKEEGLGKIKEKCVEGTLVAGVERACKDGWIVQIPLIKDWRDADRRKLEYACCDFDIAISDMLTPEEAYYYLYHELKHGADVIRYWKWLTS